MQHWILISWPSLVAGQAPAFSRSAFQSKLRPVLLLWLWRHGGQCLFDVKLKGKRLTRVVPSFECGVDLRSPLGVLFVGSLHQIVGWGPILVSLQVPELTIEEFLQECLSLGSYLTLYVYLLQCLNSEQTLRNEMKVLLLLSKWLEQVYPRWVGPLAAGQTHWIWVTWNVGLKSVFI